MISSAYFFFPFLLSLSDFSHHVLFSLKSQAFQQDIKEKQKQTNSHLERQRNLFPPPFCGSLWSINCEDPFKVRKALAPYTLQQSLHKWRTEGYNERFSLLCSTYWMECVLYSYWLLRKQCIKIRSLFMLQYSQYQPRPNTG